jgi:hypothetical protein
MAEWGEGGGGGGGGAGGGGGGGGGGAGQSAHSFLICKVGRSGSIQMGKDI